MATILQALARIKGELARFVPESLIRPLVAAEGRDFRQRTLTPVVTAYLALRQVLHGHVSALRKRLGRTRIETVPLGYRLRVEPDELDLDRFERNRREGTAVYRGDHGGGRYGSIGLAEIAVDASLRAHGDLGL